MFFATRLLRNDQKHKINKRKKTLNEVSKPVNLFSNGSDIAVLLRKEPNI